MCPDSASEAAIVTGTVSDEKTGRPIPAVIVATSALQFCAQFSDSLGRLRLKVSPGIQRIVARSRAGFLGAEGLPYEGWAVLDGWSMTVEVRDGEHYRAYRYNNPDAYDWPETRQALALGEIFNRPWRHVSD